MFERAVKPSPFVVVVNKDGNPVDVLSCSSTESIIFDAIRNKDQSNPQDAPHRAFELLDTSRMMEFQ